MFGNISLISHVIFTNFVYGLPVSFLSDLVNIFEQFIPQLLRYPNPADPLNGEAAALMNRDSTAYAAKVQDYVRRYASPSGSAPDSTSSHLDDLKEPSSLDPRKDIDKSEDNIEPCRESIITEDVTIQSNNNAEDIIEDYGYMSEVSELSDL